MHRKRGTSDKRETALLASIIIADYVVCEYRRELLLAPDTSMLLEAAFEALILLTEHGGSPVRLHLDYVVPAIVDTLAGMVVGHAHGLGPSGVCLLCLQFLNSGRAADKLAFLLTLRPCLLQLVLLVHVVFVYNDQPRICVPLARSDTWP